MKDKWKAEVLKKDNLVQHLIVTPVIQPEMSPGKHLHWYMCRKKQCEHFGLLGGRKFQTAAGSSLVPPRNSLGTSLGITPFPLTESTTKEAQSHPSCTPCQSFLYLMCLWYSSDSLLNAQYQTVCLWGRSCDMAERDLCWLFLDVKTHTPPRKNKSKLKETLLCGFEMEVLFYFILFFYLYVCYLEVETRPLVDCVPVLLIDS